MLLSFAQFEREITGERIRDKIAASKKKGMWMGGNPPLGYDVGDRKFVVNEPKAETVRHIFRRHVALGSVRCLKEGLDAVGILSKARVAESGRWLGRQNTQFPDILARKSGVGAILLQNYLAGVETQSLNRNHVCSG